MEVFVLVSRPLYLKLGLRHMARLKSCSAASPKPQATQLVNFSQSHVIIRLFLKECIERKFDAIAVNWQIDATIHDNMRLLHLLKDYLVSWSCTTSYSFFIRLNKILGRCIYVFFSCICKQHKLTFPIQKKDPKMGKEFKSWF